MNLPKSLLIIKAKSHLLVAVFFSLYGLYLRFERLANRKLWLDETNHIKATLGAFKPFWQRLTYGERTSFPGDYLLTYPFIQIFEGNKWGMAIPHIIATVLGFCFLYLICKRHFKTVWGYLITFAIVCFNTNLIFHSFELRFYAVLPTLALAVFYFSEMVVCRPEQISKKKKFLIGLFFTLTVGYNAYGILIVGCCMLFFILCELRNKSFREVAAKTFPFAFGFGIFAVPIFLWYASGNPNFTYSATSSGGMNTFDYIPNPIVDLNRFLRTVFGNLMGFKKFKPLINGIILTFLIPHQDRFKQIGFFLVLIILPIELKLLGDLHKGYWFIQRQLVWIMPLHAFLLGWCWDSIIFYVSHRPAVKKIFRTA